MRQRRKQAEPGKRVANKEPMAEGIRKKRPKGFLSDMDDDGLVAYARRLCQEKGIDGRRQMAKLDPRLYSLLLQRQLLGGVGFKRDLRTWKSMGDDRLLEEAGRMIQERGILKRSRLKEQEAWLYTVLRKRGLLDDLFSDISAMAESSAVKEVMEALDDFDGIGRPGRPRRPKRQTHRPKGFFSDMSDDELVAYAERVIREKGLKTLKDLRAADGSLNLMLGRRGLMDRISLQSSTRNFRSMDDGELIEFVRAFVEREGIRNRGEFRSKDDPLYTVLSRRRLLGLLSLPGDRITKWSRLEDDEVVRRIQAFVDRKEVRNASALQKASPSLADVMWRRGLQERIDFRNDPRSWRKIDDAELLFLANELVRKEGIESGNQLSQRDGGLFGALCRRGLIRKVKFKDTKWRWESLSDEEMLLLAREAIEEGGIKDRASLRTAHSQLYKALSNRRLLPRLSLEQDRRPFRSMGDEELTTFAARRIEERSIAGRSRFREMENYLYYILKRRGLLGSLFSEPGQRIESPSPAHASIAKGGDAP